MNERYEQVAKRVLNVFSDYYETDLSNDEILEEKPNYYDADPAGFYEELQGIFRMEYVVPKDNATVEEVIQFIAENWKGKKQKRSTRAQVEELGGDMEAMKEKGLIK